MHKRAESKNKLEAYIYEMNDYKLNENYINHGNSTEHEEINKLLEEVLIILNINLFVIIYLLFKKWKFDEI